MRRTTLIWVLLGALWLGLSLPLVLGQETLYQRDVFSLHLPFKAFGAEELKNGRIPAVNPGWGLGQPFRGNPNVLAFYPGNLLYLFLPFWSAFNLHFSLHWLLSFLTMFFLARELSQPPLSALLAGVTYAGSGWVLSCLTFYNILVVTAWWPLVLAAVVSSRRGVQVLGGVACGLALLGGDPVTAGIGVLILLGVAAVTRGWVKGCLRVLWLCTLGALIALPQIVATLRVLGFSFRGAHGVLPGPPGGYSLYPIRLLELLIPLPFGWPDARGPFAFQPSVFMAEPQLFYSLYVGLAGLWLAVSVVRQRWRWWALTFLSVLLAWLGGVLEGPLGTVTRGLFRYPEKFLFGFVLLVPLLAGWGLTRVLKSPGGHPRALAWSAVALSLAAGLGLLAFDIIAIRLSELFFVRAGVNTSSLHLLLVLAGLFVAGLGLLGTAMAVRARSGAAVLLVQVALMLQLFPLWRTDDTQPYREASSRAKKVGAGAAVLNTWLGVFPPWGRSPEVALPEPSQRWLRRVGARDLAAAPGVLHGLSYPLAPDSDGTFSVLQGLLLYNLPLQSWETRVRWMRTVGLEWAVLYEEISVSGLEEVEREDHFGVPSILYRVENTAPAAWWPREVDIAGSPREALARVNATAEPLARVVVPTPVSHGGPGTVRVLSARPDSLAMDVDGPGGVVVVRRSFHPLYRAEAADTHVTLRTLPVNLVLLGVEVPPGQHRIEISISWWPEAVASVIALLTLAGALFLGSSQGRGLRSSCWLSTWKPRASRPVRPGKAAENDTALPDVTED